MTRAENHLVFAAGESPNTFIEALPGRPRGTGARRSGSRQQRDDPGALADFRADAGRPGRTLAAHAHARRCVRGHRRRKRDRVRNADPRICRAVRTGRGRRPSNDDERHIKSFLDSLDGELRVEEDAYLPLTVDGEQVTISGIVDLVHICPDTVEIIDFKTDLERHAEDEYRKQLSVYYHVLDEWFP